MKWLKKLFQSDYDKGIEGSNTNLKRTPKTNLRAIPDHAPNTVKEGRPRRVYRGREKPTSEFDYPICSSFNPGDASSIPYILFESATRELQKRLEKIEQENRIKSIDPITGCTRKRGSIFCDEDECY